MLFVFVRSTSSCLWTNSWNGVVGVVPIFSKNCFPEWSSVSQDNTLKRVVLRLLSLAHFSSGPSWRPASQLPLLIHVQRAYLTYWREKDFNVKRVSVVLLLNASVQPDSVKAERLKACIACQSQIGGLKFFEEMDIYCAFPFKVVVSILTRYLCSLWYTLGHIHTRQT